MGKERGDQEQWRFPKVKLTEENKREIVATVVMIATKFMFQSHIYNFAGKLYNQSSGGPIGLRGPVPLPDWLCRCGTASGWRGWQG